MWHDDQLPCVHIVDSGEYIICMVMDDPPVLTTVKTFLLFFCKTVITKYRTRKEYAKTPNLLVGKTKLFHDKCDNKRSAESKE